MLQNMAVKYGILYVNIEVPCLFERYGSSFMAIVPQPVFFCMNLDKVNYREASPYTLSHARNRVADKDRYHRAFFVQIEYCSEKQS